jgi:hypothetical protein
MDATRKTARWAGLLYFLTIPTGMFGLVYAPSKLFVHGDAAATAENIRASDWLLRYGMAGELLGQIFLIYAVLVLYRLFRPVDEALARSMVVLGALISAPILFVNLLNECAALLLVENDIYEPLGRDALAYLFMQLHGRGYIVAEIFWGLWLFPFGLLVIRSGFIPRILGWALIAAGIGYVASSAAWFLAPDYQDAVDAVARRLELGELPIVFWLMIWGAWTPRPVPATP